MGSQRKGILGRRKEASEQRIKCAKAQVKYFQAVFRKQFDSIALR
jgi:hypothetical protein